MRGNAFPFHEVAPFVRKWLNLLHTLLEAMAITITAMLREFSNARPLCRAVTLGARFMPSVGS